MNDKDWETGKAVCGCLEKMLPGYYFWEPCNYDGMITILTHTEGCSRRYTIATDLPAKDLAQMIVDHIHKVSKQ